MYIIVVTLQHEGKKFNKKGEKNIFINYSHKIKGYCHLNPRKNHLEIAIDVIFDMMALISKT